MLRGVELRQLNVSVGCGAGDVAVKHDVDELFAVVTAAGASLVQLVFANVSLEVGGVLRH